MMTRMQLLRLFKKYATAAGVPECLAHPHILRHSLCTVMAEQHADVYAIEQRAGHKNISNTMIYTHVSDKHAGEACQAALMSAFACVTICLFCNLFSKLPPTIKRTCEPRENARLFCFVTFLPAKASLCGAGFL